MLWDKIIVYMFSWVKGFIVGSLLFVHQNRVRIIFWSSWLKHPSICNTIVLPKHEHCFLSVYFHTLPEAVGNWILYLFKPALSLQEIVITASPDTSIRVWGVANAQCGQMIRAHDAPVTGISLHATGDYLLSCSTDMVWRFVIFVMRVIWVKTQHLWHGLGFFQEWYFVYCFIFKNSLGYVIREQLFPIEKNS